VLLFKTVDGEYIEEPCAAYTTGPDDPFCEICTSRHHDDNRRLLGMIEVTQRIPARS
jgi:hypothetical protein